MEIRTLSYDERTTAASLLDEWRLTEGWTAGDRFRRQILFDPGYADENVWVAVDGGKISGLLTIFPRRLRILGHSVPTGGIGNILTASSLRGKGVATTLIERACEAMRDRGLELAILFPGASVAKAPPSVERGWHEWRGQRTILRRAPLAPAPVSTDSESIVLESVGPDNKRALQSVKSIHTAYGASRSGTVERDDELWQACLDLTPAPHEEFWIAFRGGLAVAYLRASIVDDVLTITELGRFEDGAGALARLIATLLEPREADVLARGGPSSAELRSFVVLPTFDDIGLSVALESRGIHSHPMDDPGASIRCVNLAGFAARLDVDLLAGEDGPKFLRRILPPDAMVFWPADRF
jgi:GNAT superfamily N-acetyltransferase